MGLTCLDSRLEHSDGKDTFTINVHARVVVYMYLIFVMTGRNICNDGDKGVQICISPTFIEPRAFTRE